jgi:hypothetical protein
VFVAWTSNIREKNGGYENKESESIKKERKKERCKQAKFTFNK